MGRFTLLLFLLPIISLIAGDLDRDWAEALLQLRQEFREKGTPEPQNKRGAIQPSLTGLVCGEILGKFPYRTDWLLQDCDNNLEAWLNQDGKANFERALLKKFPKLEANTLQALGGTEDPRWLELYAHAAEKRRGQRLEKLQETYPRIVFTKNHTLRPSFFAYTEGQSDAQAERNYFPGTALCMMEWEGAYAKVTELIDDPHGRIRDPEISFDGERIVFAWKKSDRLDDYHLYEMVPSTGMIRQLTYGLGVADFEPCFLPNGDILFSSSRCVQTVDCFTTEVSNHYVCGPNGENMIRLGFDQVHTVKPSLLSDGRIIFTRWDYNDRGQIYPQGLFQMNADGTGQTEFYGNNSWFPTTISHAREIPGSHLVMAVAMGHHTWQAGKLITIDVSKGRQEAAGVQLVAPVRETQAEKIDKYGQDGDLFQYPYPLNEREFLVAYNPLGGRPGRFSIYYMDIDGNRELLVSDPTISCQHPAPLASRVRPDVRPNITDFSRESGSYYVQDVYYGPGLKGVERGTIKKMRVVELEFRAAYIGKNYSRGPAGGALASTPVSVGNGTWDVKRIIGDATVYPDGSAFFEAPARIPLYFQCLDENNRAVQTMRSWSTLQPGETFSCVGCHEDKDSAPLLRPPAIALKAGAQKLEPFHGETRGFSFIKEIQPILDAKCVGCHQEKGEIDLSDKMIHDAQAKRNWSQSYLNLTNATPGNEKAFVGNNSSGLCVWVSAQSVPEMIPAYSVGSTASSLVDLLLEGHGELNREELDKVIAWIDLGVPFSGDYFEANAWTDKELARYDSYQAKRDWLGEQDDKNVAAMLSGNQTAPTGENRYRNIAPEAIVTANSEYEGLPQFAARNVTDGDRKNHGHGKKFPSWGPDKRNDLWLKLEWKEDVLLDRINIYIRADFKKEHDSWWKSGRVELSDGRKIPFKLKKTADRQFIKIPIKKWPPKPVRWIKFTKLVPMEDKWCGFTEVEVLGRSANLKGMPAMFTAGND